MLRFSFFIIFLGFCYSQEEVVQEKCDEKYHNEIEMKGKFLDSLDNGAHGCQNDSPKDLPLSDKNLKMLKKYIYENSK